jgi:hypothetical protein
LEPQGERDGTHVPRLLRFARIRTHRGRTRASDQARDAYFWVGAECGHWREASGNADCACEGLRKDASGYGGAPVAFGSRQPR